MDSEKDCIRLMDDEVVIAIPALKRPTLTEIHAKYPWVSEIERDDSAEDAVTLRLVTIVRADEPGVSGVVYERRLEPIRLQGKLLGYQHREWLLKSRSDFPVLKALMKKAYVEFPGIIVRFKDARFVPSIVMSGSSWNPAASWGPDLRVDDCPIFYYTGRIAVACTNIVGASPVTVCA